MVLARLAVHGHKKAGVMGFCFFMTMDAESSSERRVYFN